MTGLRFGLKLGLSAGVGGLPVRVGFGFLILDGKYLTLDGKYLTMENN
jgi:hypothetical protein